MNKRKKGKKGKTGADSTVYQRGRHVPDKRGPKSLKAPKKTRGRKKGMKKSRWEKALQRRVP